MLSSSLRCIAVLFLALICSCHGKEKREIKKGDSDGNVNASDSSKAQKNVGNIALQRSYCNEGMSLCGGRQYDPNYSFCCNEKLHRYQHKEQIRRTDNPLLHDSCCGCMTYSSQQFICCGGVLSPRDRTSANYGCCGKKAYSISGELCCGKTVIKKGDCSARCCGATVYSYFTHFCCNGFLHKKRANFYCCGAGVYNTMTQICCNGCIHRKTHVVTRCCKNVLYNPISRICCGERLYSMWTHICCYGQVRTKPYGVHTRCCGHLQNGYWTHVTTFDARKSRCCLGHVVSGSSTLPPRTTCCSNTLYVPSIVLRCCGHLTYNTTTHQCCYGVLFPKLAFHHCCGCNYIDYRRAVCCCDKQVLTINPWQPNKKKCCHNQLYDPTTGMCCMNRWFSGSSFKDCCGHRAYNPRTHACCNNKVVYGGSTLPVGHRYHYCCSYGTSDIPYNRKTHVCCCSCIHRIRTNPPHRCCRNIYFNTSTRKCCNGVVVSISTNCI